MRCTVNPRSMLPIYYSKSGVVYHGTIRRKSIKTIVIEAHELLIKINKNAL
jgi:hypothetical protein